MPAGAGARSGERAGLGAGTDWQGFRGAGRQQGPAPSAGVRRQPKAALQDRDSDLAMHRPRGGVGNEDVPMDAALGEGLPRDPARIDARFLEVEDARQVDDMLDVILRRRLEAGRLLPL